MTFFQSHRGVTLIETLIYLALFALIMTGTLSGYAAITETAVRNDANARLVQEGEFIEQRIAYRIESAQTISEPLSLATTSMLRVSTSTALSLSAPLGYLIEIQSGTQSLTDSDIVISNLAFSAQSSPLDPVHVLYSFDISLRDTEGRLHTASYSGIVYTNP